MTSLSRHIGLPFVAAVELSGCGVKTLAPVMTGIFRDTLKIRLQDVPASSGSNRQRKRSEAADPN
jgi:hypothetical protein